MKSTSNQIIENPLTAINGLLKKDIEISRIIRSRWITYILVLTSIVSMTYLVLAMNKGFNIHDEGDMVYAAARILNGEIVYKDFWHNYAPGQFYLLATLFQLFGPSLLVGRIYSTFILLLIPFVVHLSVRRIGNRQTTIIAWGLSVIWLTSFEYYCSPIPTVVLLSILSCLFIQYFLQTGTKKYLLVSGLLAGVVTVFRHDIGFYVTVSHLIVIVLYTIFYQTQDPKKSWSTFALTGKRSMIYLAGVTIVVTPVATYFLTRVPLQTLVEDLFIWNIQVFPKVYALPYPLPTVQAMVFWFPPLIYIIATGYLILNIYKNNYDVSNLKLWHLFLYLLIGVSFLNQAAMRSDIGHLFAAFFPAIINLTILMETCFDERNQNVTLIGDRSRRILHTTVLVIIVLSFLQPLRHQIVNLIKYCDSSLYIPMNVSRAKGIRIHKDMIAYEDTIQYIQKNVHKNDKIFVGNFRHDRVLIGDIIFYFLSERHSATKYHVLIPGFTTTQATQEHIIEDIEANEVQYIVSRAIDNREPNLGSISSNVYVLDEYIRNNFEEVEQIGSHKILRRKI